MISDCASTLTEVIPMTNKVSRHTWNTIFYIYAIAVSMGLLDAYAYVNHGTTVVLDSFTDFVVVAWEFAPLVPWLFAWLIGMILSVVAAAVTVRLWLFVSGGDPDG